MSARPRRRLSAHTVPGLALGGLGVVLLAAPSAARAEGALAEPPRYEACRTAQPPSLDGRLESDWAGVPWTADFQDILGAGAPAPRFRTRAKLSWDDAALYVGAELEDSDVWAALQERDAAVYQDNAFEVFLDPGADGRNYYELQTNALGTLLDLFMVQPYRDGGPALLGWDLRGLRAGVGVRGTLNRPGDVNQGWTLELALPWQGLAEAAPGQRAPRPGESWRVNLSRVQWPHEVSEGRYRKRRAVGTERPPPESYWVWSPQGAVDMHRPQRWGSVRFAAAPCPAESLGGER